MADDITDAGKDFEAFLASVLDRTEEFFSGSSNSGSSILAHSDLLEQTVKLLESVFTIIDDESDLKELQELGHVMLKLYSEFTQYYCQILLRPTEITSISQSFTNERRPGRPAVCIPCEILEDLRGVGFSWIKIAKMFRVSRWTIMRRVQKYGLESVSNYSSLTDNEIDQIVNDYIKRHGTTTGESYLRGHFRALGFHVQRCRIRGSLNRVDPKNSSLRWGALVSRRVYCVPWPNSLWHLDGHHSLIRWGFVIHGCIDGYSRRIIFLHCNTNNYASTVLELFMNAIEQDGGLWPSRIRVDYGVENTAVCDAMVCKRGQGRASYIAGSSTRNQRIERLWRDVFRCCCHAFYYTFYAMEQTGVLDIENPIHVYALQYVFLSRINHALSEWMNAFNNHPLSSECNWSPNQLWLNGMLNADNPLANSETSPQDLAISDSNNYGVDHDGPVPFEQSDNCVVVNPVELANINNDELFSFLEQSINPQQESGSFGIEIYSATVACIVQWLNDNRS